MAKRGYRGKHPNNDMKVAPTSFNAANYDKLTKEYGKIGIKQKYDYIKSHDGFYPQGSMTLTINVAIDTGMAITMSSAAGKTISYAGVATEDTSANQFDADAAAAAVATSLVNCINASEGHGGSLLASKPTTVTVLVTQVEPGPDGNTSISTGSNGIWTSCTVPGSFSGG